MTGKTLTAFSLCLVVVLLPCTLRADFTAYNDLSGTGSGQSSGNVTNISFSSTTGVGSGQLIDHASGANTGVTLQVTRFADAHRDDSFSVPAYVGDAAAEFGTILNPSGYIRHGTVGQGYVELLFTGLNPSKRYTVVVTGDRRGGSSYLSRTTRFSISDVDGFTDASSAGIPHTGTNWVEFSTGQNIAGHVARFTDIRPGADGDILVTAGVGTLGDGQWYLNSLKLVETSPADGVVFDPAEFSAVVGSAPRDVTLRIPAGSNAEQAVEVTIDSTHPAVAAPQGMCCEPIIVTFAAGESNQQVLPIEIGTAGTTTISTTNNAGLADAQLQVSVGAGQVEFSPSSLSAYSAQSVPLTVRISPGSNQTRAVEVTLTSDHPSRAVPAGAVNGSLLLTFAAGASNEQQILVNTGASGSTALRTVNDGGLADAVLPVTVVASAGTGFVAYNDVVHDSGSGHPALTSHVTTFNIGSGSPGPTAGMLIDKLTGAPTGVTATLTQSGGVNWQPSSSTGGSDCNPGTDARTVFDPAATVSLMGTVYYGSEGWWVDVTFTGLDPTRTYEFVTTANRNDPSYAGRITRYTISGADAFTNASTPGASVSGGGASTSFSTGHNTANGYVARWTGIDPGADGSFKVRADAGTSEYRAYAFDAFMLVQGPLTDSVHISPGHIDAVVGSQDVNVTLTIPAGSNASSEVNVALISDQPSVAEPQGAAGEPLIVVFAAGASNQQIVPIRIGAAGQATIDTQNDADLGDTQLTVSVSAGAVSLAPSDLLKASINTQVPLTVSISPGSNATRAVEVALTSDDALIAVPAGAVDGSLTLLFAAGAPSEQVIHVQAGQEGETTLRTTNDGGLANAMVPVSVVNLEWIKVVVDPYSAVDWIAHQRHKANMHTHTTQSDGAMNPAQVIDEYKARGYSILAITDHNRCTYPWENWGRYPDLLGMLAIAGNEPSDHHHLNSFFVPFTTTSTSVDLTLTQVGLAGGLAVLNHPGRYTYTVQDYVNWYNIHHHLFGLEVINQGGRYNGNWSRVWPGNDIVLWDRILSIMMPERPVWGLAADDMHTIGHLGRDWLTYLVPAPIPTAEATVTGWEDRPWMQGFLSDTQPDEAIVREATERGQYYFSSIGTHSTAVRNVLQTPVIDSIVVDDAAGTITIHATSGGQPLPASDYRWFSMAEQVHVGPTINFRTTSGVEKYVRAELVGAGGTTYTNPFGIALVGPTLAVSTSQISHVVNIGDSLPPDSFTIANGGPGTVSYTVSSNASWLSVDPDSGDSTGEADTIEVTYDLSGLSAGLHAATITIASPQAGNSPRTIQVTVDIRTVRPDFDRDGDVDLTDFAVLQLCLGLAPTSAGCQQTDLNDSNVIDGLDVNVFLDCLSGADIIALPGCDQ